MMADDVVHISCLLSLGHLRPKYALKTQAKQLLEKIVSAFREAKNKFSR
jgi:hypothetical protein